MRSTSTSTKSIHENRVFSTANTVCTNVSTGKNLVHCTDFPTLSYPDPTTDNNMCMVHMARCDIPDSYDDSSTSQIRGRMGLSEYRDQM
jgi:hypothetical protein